MAEAHGAAVPFAAVLLAGGRSRRMGRDKALLTLPGGRLLWERQFGILQSLGPAQLFVSGPAREGFPEGIVLLADEQPGLGPLSGIVAALERMTMPLLVVLAIDLPVMSADFLRTLLDESRDGTGVVPRWSGTGGYFEPLAAVYPQACLGIARDRLRAGELALQGLIHAAGPLLGSHRIGVDEGYLFANWNEPEKAPDSLVK